MKLAMRPRNKPMGATAVVRFKLHKGLAARRKFTAPVFSRTTYFADPRYAAPERFLGVMGMPINTAGEIEAENLTNGETVACAYKDFPDHFGFFLPLAGISTVQQISENAFDIRATSRPGQSPKSLTSD